MKLGDAALSDLAEQACGRGLPFRAGRFSVRLVSPLARVVEGVRLMYADAERLDDPFSDFTVKVETARGLRRWYRPQALFSLSGALPFAPLPLGHAYPLLEWGLNWCVSNHCHQYLIVHAAVVEKNGRALVMPGIPGAGKSTLCAVLAGRGGWRLLSDELALLDLKDGLLYPNPRPVSLKNKSIDIVRRELPGCILSEPVHDTLKGTVAHLRPSRHSILSTDTPAEPALIVFPRYVEAAVNDLQLLPQGEAFIRMAENSFNYSILGVAGFEALGAMIDRSRCFEYPNGGDLEQALADMDALVSS